MLEALKVSGPLEMLELLKILEPLRVLELCWDHCRCCDPSSTQ
jgi:hypothetical protein